MYFAFNSLSNSHFSSEKVRTLYYDVYLASLFLNLKKDFRWLNAISLESSGLFNFLALKPWRLYPANIFLHTVNYRNTRKRCEICSKLTIKTPERTYFTPFSSVSIVAFEQVKVSWISYLLKELIYLIISQKTVDKG